jgi:hypothetical protein
MAPPGSLAWSPFFAIHGLFGGGHARRPALPFGSAPAANFYPRGALFAQLQPRGTEPVHW